MTADALHGATLLLVDDEEANLDLLEALLDSEGYRRLVRCGDARRAVDLVERTRPDIVLLDLHMPFRSGFEVLADIRARTPPGEYLPVLVLTADVTPEARERALREGARDFVTKPFDAVEVLLRVHNLLETRVLYGLQHRARRAAEAAEARATLLADASRVLGASLDRATPMAQLAHLLVPRLADGCAIDVAESGTWRRVATAGTLDDGRPPTDVDEADRRGSSGDAPRSGVHGDPAWDGSASSGSAMGGPASSSTASTDPMAAGPTRTDPMARDTAGGDTRSRDVPSSHAVSSDAGSDGDDGVADPATLTVALEGGGGTIGRLRLVRAGGFDADERALADELRRRAALALENVRLFAEARAATEAREWTLSVVAHDLRNPLAAIRMCAEMSLHLLPPRVSPAVRENLEAVQQTSAQVYRLVDDLLDVSSAQHGTFSLLRRETTAAQLFAEAAATLRPLAASRGQTLSFAAGAGLPPLLVDGGRLVQVLSNLVGNAVKYAPRGGTIAVRCEMAGGEPRFSVADEGPGIAAEHLPHLFGAFWQGKPADRRGVGLGLAIARTLVEAHGGRIWVESTPGEGTTVHFTLPADGGLAASSDPGADDAARVNLGAGTTVVRGVSART
jgi:signal transduction histidine kinase/DNA-binding NarL/FixJ family response regulator